MKPHQVKVRLHILYALVAFLGISFCCLQLTCIYYLESFPRNVYGRRGARIALGVIVIAIILLTSAVMITELIMSYTNILKFKFISKLDRWTRIAPKEGESKQKISVFSVLISFLNLFALLVTVFLTLNVAYLKWLIEAPSDQYHESIVVKVLSSLGVGLQALLVALLVIALWWPFMMFTDCLITITGVLEICMTIVTSLVNLSDLDFGHHSREASVCLSLILISTGFVGFGVVFTARPYNRLTVQTSRIAVYYIVICIVTAILCIVWFIGSLVTLTNSVNSSDYGDMMISSPVLAFCGLLFSIVDIWCAARLLSTPRTTLKVEEYDLSKLSADELKAWATLIDAHSAPISPDHAKGAQALDLMKAYALSPMPGFDCKVLRVYDDRVVDTEIQESMVHTYDTVRAWSNLDDVAFFEEKKDDSNKSVKTLIEPQQSQQPKMSKNALKRAQKKNAKKAQKNKSKEIPMPDLSKKSPEEIEKEQKFRAQLMATEALLLLTTIHDYDLTSPVQGRFGRILRKSLGGESWLKPLCVKFGILGTHWPFRQMIFYTSRTKKPVARNAAILAAVSHWNDSLPSNQRRSLIYNPCYQNSNSERALNMSGWVTAKGTPSHVIDLRPYSGKSLAEYLRAIKYRNQESTFKSAHGKVIETDKFSDENCAAAIDLWKHVAEKRTSEGHTAVLKEPTASFLQSLGKKDNNKQGYRKLLFLKVDDEVIASCVLFFLGTTITSDIQGLDHEKARHYKAYFVMMQETIKIALRERIPFVDFGPTTAKAKIDIGASEIPLVGGVRASKPLSTMVQLFSDKVSL